MKKFIYNKILIFAVAAGLIASLAIAGQRHAVEISNSQIDMAIDFESLSNLAQREGYELDDILKQFKDAGITSLAIYDTTFEKLMRQGKVIAISGSEILSNYQSGVQLTSLWKEAVEKNLIDANRVYIIGRNLESYTETKEDLIRRVGEERVRVFAVGDIEVVEVKAQYNPFIKMQLGLPSDEMKIAQDAGFKILARPYNFTKCTPEDVHAVFERLGNFPVSEIVFDGPEILGAPNHVDVTVEEMKNRNLTLGLIEHFTQLQFYPQTGMNQIAKDLGYDKVARLYAIPKDEQPKLLVDAAVQRWATTDHERNIRINLFRIYDKPAPDMTLLETNLKYISDAKEKLQAENYTFGAAGTFENYYPNRFLRMLVVVGVAAAVILYLSLISRRFNSAFALLAIIFAVPVLIGGGGKVRILSALISANIFPALAIIWQLDRLQFIRVKAKASSASETGDLSTLQIVWLSVAALLLTSLTSMVGAAYLSGSLSDVQYFLEFEIFRGIKLTFVLPLILVAIAFLQRFNVVDEAKKNFSALGQFKDILNMNITVKSLLAALIVLAGFAILILRSGHTAGMPVAGAEMKIRAMLEQFFYARPRSKEIFFGHPAFILAMAAFLKKFPKSICFVLTIAATVGQSSMVETFAHMRTPIFMSFMRGVDGVIPGAIIGAILILFLQIFYNFKSDNR